MDEWARVAHLAEQFHAEDSSVRVGIGDDAAFLTNGIVASVDTQVEHVHFKREWLSFRELGYRAVMSAASDLSAKGVETRWILSAAALPMIDDGAFKALVDGTAEAASDLGACVIGGNLSRASEISLTTTVLGSTSMTPILRSGARVGDSLFVSGMLGERALGRFALEANAGPSELSSRFVNAWRRVRARTDVALTLHVHEVSAAIDLSDGLLSDARHLAHASNVQLEIDYTLIPRADDSATFAASLGLKWSDVVLAGGEDYEILFTASSDRVPFGCRIGRVIAGPPDVTLLNVSVPRATGFNHFR